MLRLTPKKTGVIIGAAMGMVGLLLIFLSGLGFFEAVGIGLALFGLFFLTYPVELGESRKYGAGMLVLGGVLSYLSWSYYYNFQSAWGIPLPEPSPTPRIIGTFLVAGGILVGSFLARGEWRNYQAQEFMNSARMDHDNDLARAESLERAGRFEEAAQIHERWGRADRAGQLRQRAKTTFVEQNIRQTVRTEHVDLNRFLDQLKGLVHYPCPSCGAPIAISSRSDVSSLQSCRYCHAPLNTQLIASFVQSTLDRP